MATENIAIRIIEIVLALALLGTLFFAGQRVYRALPPGPMQTQVNDSATRSELTVVLRDGASGDIRIQLYQLDFAAAQREFVLQGRPGKSLEDFLGQLMRKLAPVNVQVDQSGRGVARLSEGSWWLRATSAASNGEVIEWRVPLTISQRAHTIELSRDNAYERTRKF